jgi:hypothetical protein
MSVLLPSDYQWKTRPKSEIIPGDPVTKYKRLVWEAYESGYEHWRTMLGILGQVEEHGL